MMWMLAYSLFFNLLQLTENRVCMGASGKVCCDGFMLNQSTGLCQSATKEISDRRSTSVIFRVSNGAGLYQTVDQYFSKDVKKYEDSTTTYLPTNNDFFTNNFVINLIQVIVSLVGVFVFFFAACVVTYIYIKCFRQTMDGKNLNSSQCESEYKSLDFESVEYESPFHPDPEQHVNLELTYLTPVVRSIRERETSSLSENDILADIRIQRHVISSPPKNEPIPTTDNLQNHVYIEILEDNIESL